MRVGQVIAVAMLTSKGAAGVSGAGFITLAATLSSVHPDWVIRSCFSLSLFLWRVYLANFLAFLHSFPWSAVLRLLRRLATRSHSGLCQKLVSQEPFECHHRT